MLKPGSWVVVDEVQKVPALLNEVHRLIENHKLRFILSGSSARKLKRDSTNLLAGRAILTPFLPLVSAEVGFEFKGKQIRLQGVYCGTRAMQSEEITVLPVGDFLKKLWAGDIIS